MHVKHVMLFSSLKEKHVNVCARRFNCAEFTLTFVPYPGAIGMWLDAKNKRGAGCMLIEVI